LVHIVLRHKEDIKQQFVKEKGVLSLSHLLYHSSTKISTSAGKITKSQFKSNQVKLNPFGLAMLSFSLFKQSEML